MDHPMKFLRLILRNSFSAGKFCGDRCYESSSRFMSFSWMEPACFVEAASPEKNTVTSCVAIGERIIRHSPRKTPSGEVTRMGSGDVATGSMVLAQKQRILRKVKCGVNSSRCWVESRNFQPGVHLGV